MDLNHYRFRSIWTVPAAPDRCFNILHDFSCYPHWWPEVREVVRSSDDRALVEIRAVLPYSLRFEMTREIADPDGKVLEASMAGDLEGWSRWEIRSSGAGSVLMFEEEARLNKPGLRRLAVIARPIFRLNHALMMWRGERGLRRYVTLHASDRGDH